MKRLKLCLVPGKYAKMLAINDVLFDALCESHPGELAELKMTGGEGEGGYMCVCVWWDGEKSIDNKRNNFFDWNEKFNCGGIRPSLGYPEL